MHERQNNQGYDYHPIESNLDAHLGERPHPDYRIRTEGTPRVGEDGLAKAIRRKLEERRAVTDPERRVEPDNK